MSEEVELSVAEVLRGLVDVVSGSRLLILAVVSRLPESAAPEDETPEEGAALVGSALRCIVNDQIDPAIRSLESLIEAALEAPSSEPET